MFYVYCIFITFFNSSLILFLYSIHDKRSTEKFQWQDFLVLGLVLGISGVIGIFFAWKDRNKSTEEYMLGGGKVNPIPE